VAQGLVRSATAITRHNHPYPHTKNGSRRDLADNLLPAVHAILKLTNCNLADFSGAGLEAMASAIYAAA